MGARAMRAYAQAQNRAGEEYTEEGEISNVVSNLMEDAINN
jgi:hypothetical protein